MCLLMFCYLGWAVSITILSDIWLPLGITTAAVAIALHSSLQHEIIHGHPFRNRWLNALCVAPTLNLAIPFVRFRDTHLQHHQDANLTDPYDDPETNYLDPKTWDQLAPLAKTALRINNTLFGRLVIGPVVSQIAFMRCDLVRIKAGDKAVRNGWLWHIPSVALVLSCVIQAKMPVWAYLISAYMGLSILKIRTFLEHQAHDHTSGRTVIIEDRGVLALLFLNNNLHIVHHIHPRVPWYRLPKLYFDNRERYLKRNFGYRYASYTEIFRHYFWAAKDTVPHPMRKG